MANICLYKIKVRGRKRACYALVDMMPLYSWEKEYLREEGTEDDFELVFLGACKWAVDCYTSKMKNPVPFTEEELNAVGDGDHWDESPSTEVLPHQWGFLFVYQFARTATPFEKFLDLVL